MTNGKSTISRRGRRIFKLFQDSLFQSSIIDDWEMHLVNMVLWLENALYISELWGLEEGGKKLAVRVEGNWGEPMVPLNPPSASNTNPVRNGYLRRSKWNGIFFFFFVATWLKIALYIYVVSSFQSSNLDHWIWRSSGPPRKKITIAKKIAHDMVQVVNRYLARTNFLFT